MSNPSQDSSTPSGDFPDGWAPGQLPAPKPPQRNWIPWIVVAVAVVITVTVSGVLAMRGDAPATASAAEPSATRSVLPSGQPPKTPDTIVSAGDNGPVALVTDDVTCGVWDNVQTSVSIARNGGWSQRDPWVPASTWDPATRSEFEAVADALRSGADRTVALAAQTPHRVMRELYETFIAYGRAYAEGMSDYQPMSHYLAETSLAAVDSITNICGAARSKVAGVQASTLTPAAAPTTRPAVDDPANPQRFLAQASPSCDRWAQDEATLKDQTQAWSALDPNIAVGQLDKEQSLTYSAAAQAFTAHADAMVDAGKSSNNPAVEDFATLGALYFRAYAQAVPMLWSGDHDLAQVGFSVSNLITQACSATKG
jgi:hypothetical protein